MLGAVSPRVRFLPSNRSVRVASGTTLIDAVRRASLPIASACGADGLCARCGLEIVEGGEALEPESEEERAAKRRNRIDPSLRLACRVRVTDDLVVAAAYWPAR
jgi:ferredoxin